MYQENNNGLNKKKHRKIIRVYNDSRVFPAVAQCISSSSLYRLAMFCKGSAINRYSNFDILRFFPLFLELIFWFYCLDACYRMNKAQNSHFQVMLLNGYGTVLSIFTTFCPALLLYRSRKRRARYCTLWKQVRNMARLRASSPDSKPEMQHACLRTFKLLMSVRISHATMWAWNDGQAINVLLLLRFWIYTYHSFWGLGGAQCNLYIFPL